MLIEGDKKLDYLKNQTTYFKASVSCLLLLLFIVSSCGDKIDETSLKIDSAEENMSTSPLDLILGEKVLNYEANEIRPDNFKDFLNLKRSDFTDSSDIYDITVIDNLFIALKQKRTYNDAQKYGVIIKLNGEDVVAYEVIYNFDIIDLLRNEEDLYILATQLNNVNDYWTTDRGINLRRMNSNLMTLWMYHNQVDEHPLNAQSIKMTNEGIVLNIDMITGCSMCYNDVDLLINKDGACTKATVNSIQNTSVRLSQDFLNSTFCL